MKIILIGYPGSQFLVPFSKYLTEKYLPGFEIIYLNYEGPIDGWAKYLSDYLSTLEDKHIILALDDYLISGPINETQYKLAETHIKYTNGMCIKLCHGTKEEHLEYPVTTQYTIWDRDQLIWLLVQIYIPIQTPWEFEIHGSKMLKDNMKYSPMHVPCIPYFTNSALSGRWQGVNLEGLNEEDLNYFNQWKIAK